MFFAFLLELPCCKDHVYCSSVSPKIHIDLLVEDQSERHVHLSDSAGFLPVSSQQFTIKIVTDRFPFRLYREIMYSFLNACGIASFLQTQ